MEALVYYPLSANQDTNSLNEYAANAATVGAVYGVAYQRSTERVFTSAFLKRHSGFGPLGTSGIYVTDMNQTPAVTTNFIDLSSIGIDGGLDPRLAGHLSTDSDDPNRDPAAFDAVGRLAFGDLEISEDETTLWLVNLNNRTLYEIFIGVPFQTPTAADVTAHPIPNVGGCSNGEYVPFGLGVRDGLVYLGVVCTAQTSRDIADLDGFVFTHDPAGADGNFTQVFQMDLTYPRGAVSVAGAIQPSARWRPWISTWGAIDDPVAGLPNMPTPGTSGAPFGKQAIYPQAIISDIEFDVDGSLILGFLDRFGHQSGNANFSPVPGDNFFHEGSAAGDILYVCNTNGTYTLESAGAKCPGSTPSAGSTNAQGPGNGEFYWLDRFSSDITPFPGTLPSATGGTHQETTLGDLAHYLNSGLVMSIAYDPADNFRAGGTIGYETRTASSGASTRFSASTRGEAPRPSARLRASATLKSSQLRPPSRSATASGRTPTATAFRIPVSPEFPTSPSACASPAREST